MKKIFFVLCVAGALVACNNDGELNVASDTTPIVVPAPTVVDTFPTVGDTTAMDTTVH